MNIFELLSTPIILLPPFYLSHFRFNIDSNLLKLSTLSRATGIRVTSCKNNTCFNQLRENKQVVVVKRAPEWMKNIDNNCE